MRGKARTSLICWAALLGAAACLGAAERRYVELVGEDAPLRAQVQWYIKAAGIPVDVHYVLENPEDEFQQEKGRILRDLRARPNEYFPLLVQELDEAENLGLEATAVRIIADAVFVETRPEEVREILRSYLTGERESPHESEGRRWVMGAVLWHYPKVARPEDAWELLPHVETAYGSAVISAISKIADPSIIPALEEAVRRRTEKFPEDYTNIEGYLSYNLERITDKIRARYPNWSEENRKGPGSPSPAEQDAAPPSEAEAEETQEPPEASESSEAGEASKGSLALWTALVAGALAVAALEARRRAGKR